MLCGKYTFVQFHDSVCPCPWLIGKQQGNMVNASMDMDNHGQLCTLKDAADWHVVSMRMPIMMLKIHSSCL